IAAAASARLCTSSSVSTDETRRFAEFAAGLRDRSAHQVSAVRFRSFVRLDLKTQLTTATHAQQAQVVRQVSEKKVIVGVPTLGRPPYNGAHSAFVPVCEASRHVPARQTQPAVARGAAAWRGNVRSL